MGLPAHVLHIPAAFPSILGSKGLGTGTHFFCEKINVLVLVANTKNSAVV
jgi:hypothetical protein